MVVSILVRLLAKTVTILYGYALYIWTYLQDEAGHSLSGNEYPQYILKNIYGDLSKVLTVRGEAGRGAEKNVELNKNQFKKD